MYITRWRHYVGFVRNLVKAGSVEFVERAVEHVGLFFVAKKAGAQRFIIDARACSRHFLTPPSGPLLTGEGLCHVDFQGALDDAQNWFVGWADIKNALHQMRIPEVNVFFALPAVLATEVGKKGKAVDQERLAPDSLIYPVLTTSSDGFFPGRFSSVKTSRITARAREVLTLFSSFRLS